MIRAIRDNRRRRGFTLIELLAVISIIGILLGLLFPAVQMVRESSRKIRCANHLKQLSLAMLNFESQNRFLPSGGWGKNWAAIGKLGSGPNQPGGWIYQILPFVEQESLYNLGGTTDSDMSANLQRLQTPLPLLHCPSRRSADRFAMAWNWHPLYHGIPTTVARNDYAMNGGSVYVEYGSGPDSLESASHFPWPSMRDTNGLIHQRSAIQFQQVTDGLSNTYMIGEKRVPSRDYQSGEDWGDNESAYSGDDRDIARYTWHSPLSDFGAKNAITHRGNQGTRFGSAHNSGFNMSFSDGSVHAISYSIDHRVYTRQGDRSDGQTLAK